MAGAAHTKPTEQPPLRSRYHGQHGNNLQDLQLRSQHHSRTFLFSLFFSNSFSLESLIRGIVEFNCQPTQKQSRRTSPLSCQVTLHSPQKIICSLVRWEFRFSVQNQQNSSNSSIFNASKVHSVMDTVRDERVWSWVKAEKKDTVPVESSGPIDVRDFDATWGRSLDLEAPSASDSSWLSAEDEKLQPVVPASTSALYGP
ncbi:hypothetical protein QBC37DRAFT_404960 [Rhypophila decipiens]|uniref:Uncharacterized protein n=1 Tax=Rhypophila decipiens TaxID=261697 RepID=A0AAN6XZX3_9PEZI|nr:hypothetical protein QBC37DRAFT_404960 [Rhypophila decipiens]